MKSRKQKSSSFIFLALPHKVLNSDDYLSLSPRAVKLLIDISVQYNGKNNGDLCICLSIMKTRGWTSNDQLKKAKDELIKKEFIKLTRQGGRRIPNLYAITWQPIDECDGKLDVSHTRLAPRKFR